jgi:hypothetical protein
LIPGFIKSSGEHKRKIIAIGRPGHTQTPSTSALWPCPRPAMQVALNLTDHAVPINIALKVGEAAAMA